MSPTTHSIGSKTRMLRTMTQNRVSRRILKGILKKCGACGDSRLNVGLEMIAGIRKSACASCRLATVVIRSMISIGSSAFGADSDFVNKGLSDSIFRKSLSSVISGIADFGTRTPFVPGAPFQVVWNVTRACNLKCKHCYEEAGGETHDEMSTKNALICIDRLADSGVVFLAFSGGEPTLRHDIRTLIRRATKRGIYVALATNGTTLSRPQKVRELKKAGLRFVQISLDGAIEETHDSFRGVPGTFRKTITGIENCVAENLFVEVAMTVTRHNLAELSRTVELCRSLRVKWFMIYNFVPVGRGLTILETDLTPIEREKMLRNIIDDIVTRSNPKEMEILSTAPQLGRVARMIGNERCSPSCEASDGVYPTHFFNARLPLQMRELSEFIGGCGAGRFYLAIEPNGDVYPCVFFPHSSKVKVGNILKDDFKSLWTNSVILKDLRNKDLLKGACGVCENRYVCGGCRARGLQYFNDVHAPDPGCVRNLEFWKALKVREEVHEKLRPAMHRVKTRPLQRR